MSLLPGWNTLRHRLRRDLCQRLAKRTVRLNNPTAMVSFTFDDFPRSALFGGGEILRQYGLAGTYYASFGLMGTDTPTGRIFQAADIETVISQGHELGCHTYSHCHAWETQADVFEQAVIENQQCLDRLLPGATFRTMSYPISCARPNTKRRSGRRFACCRGAGQGFNVGNTDLNYLKAFFLEKSQGNLGEVREMIERNRVERGWLIFATHDVTGNPTSYGCTPTLFESVVREAVQSGAVILPVFQALQTAVSKVEAPTAMMSGS